MHGSEGIIRLALCVALFAAGVGTPWLYGLALVLPPFGAIALALRGQRGLMQPGPVAPYSELSGALSLLLLGSVLAQLLSYASFLAANILATPGEKASVGLFITGLFIARIPILLFQAVQAALLPKLAGLAGEGRHDDFRAGMRKLVLIVIGLGILGTIAAATIGPFVGELLFGKDKFILGHRDLALLALGSGCFILALTLAQGLIALRGYAAAAVSWMVGIVAFVRGHGRRQRPLPARRARIRRRHRGGIASRWESRSWLARTAGSRPMVSRSSSRTFLTNRSRSERVRASETRLLVEAHRRDPLAVPSPDDAPAVPRHQSTPRALLRLARPKQWVKNILVLAAPGAAGVLDQSAAVRDTAIAFVCFCLAASGTYYLNDALDVEADRVHPTKRFRPVAAGDVSVRMAITGAIILEVLAIALSFLARPELALVIAGYLALDRRVQHCGSSTKRSSTWRPSRPASCCARSPAASRSVSTSRRGS